jgi:hypothetical protein
LEFEELFAALNKVRVKYLLIGGYATILHGVPRSTQDIDIAIYPDPENLGRCIDALKTLGLKSDTEHVDDILGQGGITFEDDISVDLVTDLPGKLQFQDLWKTRMKLKFRGVIINVISKKDQIRILGVLNRPQDMEDLRYLEGRRKS